MLTALLTLLLAAPQEPPAPDPAPVPAATDEIDQEVGPETVVATVGDVALTMEELRAEVNRLIPLNYYHGKVPVEKQREFRDTALSNLVERTLIHLDALERDLQATEEELRAELQRSIDKAGATGRVDEAMFEDLLQQLGPTIAKRVLIDKNEKRFQATIREVTDQDVEAAYAERREHLKAPELIQVREILINVVPGATEEQALAVRARIQLVLDELLAGGDFETLAMLHSEHESATRGGDLGLVPNGRLRTPELIEALAQLADGETSGLVRTRYGYHILQRVKTEPPRQLEFAEIQDALRMQVASAIAATAREQWLDELRDRYPVEIRDIVKDEPEEGSADQAAEPSEARAER